MTHENEENCSYLLKYENGRFLDLVHTLYKLCNEEVALHPDPEGVEDRDSVQATLREALMDGMRVYINLVHDYHEKREGEIQAMPLILSYTYHFNDPYFTGRVRSIESARDQLVPLG